MQSTKIYIGLKEIVTLAEERDNDKKKQALLWLSINH